MVKDFYIKLVVEEYEKFRMTQDENFESDFDREIQKITTSPKNRKKDNS